MMPRQQPKTVIPLLLGLLLLSASARAEERKSVAVLDVVGAPRVQLVIQNVVKKTHTLVPLAKWNAAAKRLGAMGRASDEIAMVAGDLKVDAVVTATVKKDKESGTWTLNVSARHGPTGKAVDKLRYPLKGPRVDPATLKQLANEVGPAVDQAIMGPPAEPEPVAAAPLAPPKPKVDEDNPFARVAKTEEEEKKAKDGQRPVFYPWFDVSAGFVLGGRRFSFEEEPGPSPTKCYDFDKRIIDPNDPAAMRTVFRYTNALRKCPGFSASVAGGLRLDGTVYPLAFLNINALRGLGLGATFDYFFWPASRVCNKNADGACVSAGSELETRQLRLEVGLRWMWNILHKRSRPSILLSLMYGFHQFAIQKEKKMYDTVDTSGMAVKVEGVDDHGLPDLRYQYLDIGLGGRVPLVANEKWFLGMLLDFHFHAMLDYGDIATRFIDFDQFYGGYGPVSGGYGIRVGFTPVEFVWKGLTARVSGYYEQFAMSFDLANADKGNPLPPIDRTADTAARHLAQGATDQYFGGVLQLGYQY